MRKLPLVIVFCLYAVMLSAQESPHGRDFNLSCLDCHSTDSWDYVETGNFSHSSTDFKLEGQHVLAACRACHISLEFSAAKTSCSDCHSDMHNTTLGFDCDRCHTPSSWLVSNITEIHQMSRFPLLGAHNSAECIDCHTSVSQLEFDVLDIDCYACHQEDYLAAISPNHVQLGYSTDCMECHRIDAFEWPGAGIEHSFFPLTLGHQINECAACHKGSLAEPLATNCFSCHEGDFMSTSEPSHQLAGFTNSCEECHSTQPDWRPAEFRPHDGNYFPIYSGNHSGEWNSCAECHTQAGSYSLFSCIDCHEHSKRDTDNEHEGIPGYEYVSELCLACHPTGDSDNAFNHNETGFPLTGAHRGQECISCHSQGYSGTSNLCSSCHLTDYNSTTNPVHPTLGLSMQCEICHTTGPGWDPALFPDHNSYHQLNGAHAGVEENCYLCHNGNYINTPNTCYECHQNDYNSAADPNHLTAQFPKDCQSCHSESVWDPSTFDHDNQYFPIYSGKHRQEWNSCMDCHIQATNYAVFSCIDCHEHNKTDTDEHHKEVSNYDYLSIRCLECHPIGESD